MLGCSCDPLLVSERQGLIELWSIVGSCSAQLMRPGRALQRCLTDPLNASVSLPSSQPLDAQLQSLGFVELEPGSVLGLHNWLLFVLMKHFSRTPRCAPSTVLPSMRVLLGIVSAKPAGLCR